MKYRAKITRIFSQIESCYNLREYNVVRETRDSYIEVDNPDEADVIDHLNRLREEYDKLYIQLLTMRGH